MQGRVIVITGSTRGIGLALATACRARGAIVVTHGRDTFELATDPEALIAHALAAHGRIDVLVNNAAISPARQPLWELDPRTIDTALDVNLRAPMLCSRALLAWAIPAGHHVRIVNVSSGITALPRDGAAAYTASKAALDGFTRALALDVGERATITAVALGGHQTELSKSVLSDDEFARLPAASAATRSLLHAIAGDADQLHGRVLEDRAPVLDTSAIDLLAHPIGPSPRARAALERAAIDRYPERDHVELRKLLAAQHGVGIDTITLGGGVSELLDRTLRAAARPGETVVAHAPSWPVLRYLLATHGLVWQRASYSVGEHADHDLQAIALDRRVRVVYLTSPSNPCGRALGRSAFEAFLDRLPPQVTVIVDEAYAGFSTREDVVDAAPYVAWCDQLVVLRSFSKLHGLAGLRIGYAISSAKQAQILARIAPAFALTRGAADAAVAAISDHAHTRRIVTEVIARRTALEASLDARRIARLASDAPFVLAADPQASGPRFFDRYVMLPAWAEIAS